MTASTIREHTATYGLINVASGPFESRKYIVKSGVTIRKGRHVCLAPDGFVDQYYVRSDYRYVGVALETIVGDGTAMIGVDISGRREMKQTITGLADQADVGEEQPVYLVEDGEAYTFTQQSPTQQPVAVCEYFNATGTVGDLRLRIPDVFLALRDDNVTIYGKDRQRLVKHWDRLPAATRAVTTDLDIDATGTNVATSTIALQAGGGASLATAGADNDQVTLWPVAASGWAGPFAPSRRPVLISKFKTGASIAAVLLEAALRLTDVMDLTTDADAIGVKFDTDALDTTLKVFYSIAGVDTVVDSLVTLAVNTNYTVAIVIREDGVGEVYIGSGDTKILQRVAVTSGALTAAAALKPRIVGVQALAAAAKTVITRYAEISQDHE